MPTSGIPRSEQLDKPLDKTKVEPGTMYGRDDNKWSLQPLKTVKTQAFLPSDFLRVWMASTPLGQEVIGFSPTFSQNASQGGRGSTLEGEVSSEAPASASGVMRFLDRLGSASHSTSYQTRIPPSPSPPVTSPPSPSLKALTS